MTQVFYTAAEPAVQPPAGRTRPIDRDGCSHGKASQNRPEPAGRSATACSATYILANWSIFMADLMMGLYNAPRKPAIRIYCKYESILFVSLPKMLPTIVQYSTLRLVLKTTQYLIESYLRDLSISSFCSFDKCSMRDGT